jgi:glycosyltransferase involved in cell wall biosynthesis
MLKNQGAEVGMSLAPWPRLEGCAVSHIFAGSDWAAVLEQVVNARIQGIPVVITAFRWPRERPDLSACASAEREAARLASSISAQAALSLADLVVTMSRAQERLLKISAWLDSSFGTPELASLPFPVSPTYEVPPQTDERLPGQRFVLCPGTVIPENGQLDLLAAAGEPAGPGLDAPLRFVGSTTCDADYAAQCSQLFRPGDVLLGALGESELAKLYGEAAASCLLAHDDHVRLGVLESCAAGIPTVSTPQESLQEYVGEGALYVDRADAQAVRQSLAKALESPRAAPRRLGSDPQAYAARLLDIYAAAGPAGRGQLNMALVCEALSWRLQSVITSLPESAAAAKVRYEETLRAEKSRADDIYRRFRRIASLPVISQYLAFRRWLASLGQK